MSGSLLRRQNEPGNNRVGYAELFFDLVFVFSIIQLSHTLAHHFDALGIFETLMLVFAVWWVWIYTAWATNWLNPERMPVRILLFLLMFGGLLMSVAIPDAFGEDGLVFALALVAMQVGRTVFAMFALRRHDPRNYRNFQRITGWLVLSGIFWIAGGLSETGPRILLWLIAVGLDYAAPALGFRLPGLGRSTIEDWNVSGAHMAERCALFIIICLGETILVTGRTFADMELSAFNLSLFATAFVATLAMWWIYFQFGHERAAHRIEHDDLPGALARLVFTYAHVPVVAGIILSAVAIEFVLAHPHGATDIKTMVAIIGGPLVFIVGNIWFKRPVYGQMPLSHLVGLALLLAAAPLYTVLEPAMLYGVTVAILVVVAVWEYRSLGTRRSIAPAHGSDGSV